MTTTEQQVRTLEVEVFLPVNPYRTVPTQAQIEYATGLCYQVLEFPQRTIDRFDTMSRAEMTRLILALKRELSERGPVRAW